MNDHLSDAPPEILVEEDPEHLARTVADQLISTIAALQGQGRVPSVVLTGGSIADKIHQAVAQRGDDARVDWQRVELFWGDERFVGPDSDDRNENQARRALLDHVDVDPDHVHPIAADDGATTLDDAVRRYDDVVAGRAFDIVMLGVGPDGHIASLFPGKPTLTVDDQDVVSEPDSPKPPPRRVSLTLAALNRGREVWFVAAGEAKADAVARAVVGDPITGTPAAGVHGTEQTLWMLDADAASRIPAALIDQ